MRTTASSTMKRFFSSSCLPSHIHLSKFPSVGANVRKVCWTSLNSGRSPHDGGQRFFRLGLTWRRYGFSDYWKAAVCTINVLVAVVASRRIIWHLLLRYRRVMPYVASRRIILLLLCFVGGVMPFVASRRITFMLRSRRITLLLRLWSLRWTMVI